MLGDRDYMRSNDGDRWAWMASPTAVLLAVNAAVFAFQCINTFYIGSPVERLLALSADGLRQGFLWQLLTFQFLHFDFLHFLFNSIGIWFLGRAVENTAGRARFWEIYLLAGTLGGLLQAVLGLVFPSIFGGITMGASAGLSGLLAVFCLLFRDAELRLFFFIPVKAFHLLVGSLVLAAFFVLVPVEGGIAHAAHLGGLLAGVAYYHWVLRHERRLFDWRPYADAASYRSRPRATLMSRMHVSRRRPSPPVEELPPAEFISKEVDPILDKISQHGIQSLTDREKKILERARSKMAKR